jgi:hypothetical protein
MPAENRTVQVTYVPECYSLSLNFDGSGTAPIALPGNSTGCSSGQYHVGEVIQLTAHPASDYHSRSVGRFGRRQPYHYNQHGHHARWPARGGDFLYV